MRLTGLGPYTKGLAHHNPVEATALENRLDRIKWRLWHGDADEALTRAEQLAADVAALDSGYPRLPRLIKATADLAGYIADNADLPPIWRTPMLAHAASAASSNWAGLR